MDLVKIHGTLQKHDLVYSTMLKISNKVKELPNYDLLKLNHDLTAYVCSLIETLIKKKYQVDKKEIAMQILTDLFNLNADEIDQLSKQIDFLISIGVIKRISYYRRIVTSISNFFLRRFVT